MNDPQRLRGLEVSLAFSLKPCLPAEPDWGNPYKAIIESLYRDCVNQAAENYNAIFSVKHSTLDEKNF